MQEMFFSEHIAFKRLVEGSSPSGRTQEAASNLAVFLFLVPVSLTLFRFVHPLFPHYSENQEHPLINWLETHNPLPDMAYLNGVI